MSPNVAASETGPAAACESNGVLRGISRRQTVRLPRLAHQNDTMGTRGTRGTKYFTLTNQSVRRSVNWLYSIHSTLINNLVGAFNRTNANSVPGLRTKDGKPVCYSCFVVKVADYPSTPPGIDLLATNDWGGFAVGQNTNIINRYNVSLADTVTWTRGKHMVVAGVNILDQTWD